MAFLTSMGFWWQSRLRVLVHECGSILCLHKPELKDFLTSCLSQFKVYIWSIAQHYNINEYLDEIKEKIDISLDPLKVLGQKSFLIIFSLVILRSRFSIKTLMFSSQNF
jgi:hypothetical protein